MDGFRIHGVPVAVSDRKTVQNAIETAQDDVIDVIGRETLPAYIAAENRPVCLPVALADLVFYFS